MFSGVALAGDLNPPPGPVAPSMKTLDEVEPRTAINQANTPGDASATFVISEPGSYYLTENVTPFAGTIAIRVVVDNVTIDLNGFTVFGAGGPPVNTIDGGFADHVTIRNGVVQGSTANGILLDDFATVENVSVRDCTSFAIRLGGSARVTGCRAIFNIFGISCEDNAIVTSSSTRGGQDGFSIGSNSVLTNCASRDAAISAFVVGVDSALTRCNAHEAVGINLPSSIGFNILDNAILTECNASGQGIAGFRLQDNATLERCTATRSDGKGFDAEANASFTSCIADGNFTEGFSVGDAATFVSCRATDNNSTGFEFGLGSNLSMCSAIGNNGFGYQGDGILENCVAQDGNDTGFNMGPNSVLTDCVSGFNDGNGFVIGANSTLTRCLADGGNGDGYTLGDGSSAESCTARFVSGISFEIGSRCALTNCKSESGSGNAGFLISGEANTLRGCVANNENRIGFETSGSQNSFIECIASGCGTTGFSYIGGATAGGNVTTGCQAKGNGDFGFFVGSINNSLIGCHAIQNGLSPNPSFSDGGFIANASFASGSVFRDNVAVGNNVGFYAPFVNAGLSFFSNTASSSVGLNYVLSPTGNFIGDIETTPNSGNPGANLSIN